MTFPFSHPIPCRPCHSNCQCNREPHQMEVKPAVSQVPQLQDPFRDDFRGTAKVFQKLNSFRRLFGFKHVQWDNILSELAVVRSREFTRGKRMRMPFTVGGSKFNLGVPFFDLVMYIAAEHENGKMIPVEKSLWKAWSVHQRCSQYLLEPLAKLAAVSVVKNETTICFTVLVSKLPPFFFPPVMRRRPTEKEEVKNVEKWDKIMQEIGLISDSLETFDGEDDDNDDANDGDDEDNRVDEDYVEVCKNGNDDAIAEDVIDEYANDNPDETRWDEGGEESKTKASSLQRVIYEVPLIKPPHQSMSQLPSVFLNSTEDENFEGIFEEYKTAANDRSADAMLGEADFGNNASNQILRPDEVYRMKCI